MASVVSKGPVALNLHNPTNDDDGNNRRDRLESLSVSKDVKLDYGDLTRNWGKKAASAAAATVSFFAPPRRDSSSERSSLDVISLISALSVPERKAFHWKTRRPRSGLPK